MWDEVLVEASWNVYKQHLWPSPKNNSSKQELCYGQYLHVFVVIGETIFLLASIQHIEQYPAEIG